MQTIKRNKNCKTTFSSKFLYLLSCTLLLLSGCQTIDSTNNWPSNLPDRQLFVESYETSIKDGDKVIALEPHLTWIKRFYQGTTLYPFGWNKMTSLLLDSLASQTDKNIVEPRLYQLGLDISNEWAKDNAIRKITSSNIIVWGSALRIAAKEGKQLQFLDQIEQDVASLLEETLSSKDIRSDRYNAPEDFDDF